MDILGFNCYVNPTFTNFIYVVLQIITVNVRLTADGNAFIACCTFPSKMGSILKYAVVTNSSMKLVNVCSFQRKNKSEPK